MSTNPHLPTRRNRGGLRSESGIRLAIGSGAFGGRNRDISSVGIFVVPARIAGLRDGSGYGVWMRSDADGRFVFGHLLAPGERVLELRADGYREAHLKVTTGSTDIVTVTADTRVSPSTGQGTPRIR